MPTVVKISVHLNGYKTKRLKRSTGDKELVKNIFLPFLS